MSSNISVSVSVPSINKFVKKIQRTANVAIRKVTNKINNAIGGFGIGLSMGGGYQDSALEEMFYSSDLGVEPGTYREACDHSSDVDMLFIKDRANLWGYPSIYGPSEDKNQAPYSWVKLTDTDKYDRKDTTQANPVASITRDITRISNLIGSSVGTSFSQNQVDLQKQNIFPETRTWDRKSVINSVGRKPGELRFPRHIIGGTVTGDTVTNIATDAKPTGVAPAISLSAKSHTQWPTSGFIRGNTGNKARRLFTAIWTSAKSGAEQTSATTMEDADWKIRPEYTDDEKNVFKAFLTDQPTLLSYKVGEVTYTASGVHKYYGIGQDVRRYSPRARVIQYPADKDSKSIENNESTGKIIANQKLLSVEAFKPNESNGKVGIKRDESEFSLETGRRNLSEINEIGQGYKAIIDDAISRWQTVSSNFNADLFYGRIDDRRTYKKRMEIARTPDMKYGNIKRKSSLEQSKKFGGAQKVDDYNMLGVLSGNPKELFGATRDESADTIFFYFYDLINDKYIPFRATLTGISENTSANWDDVQYMGRADKLLTYNGFSREMNFGFHVNANSIRELIPMWNRINYLSGLTRPAKYTSAGDGMKSMAMANFIYPPLIRITIGDLYTDQPGVISSFGLTIPDDSPWETVRVGTDKTTGTYTYLEDTPQAIRIDNVMSRQLPLNVNISISMKLLEKELAMTKKNLYFDPTQLSKHTGI